MTVNSLFLEGEKPHILVVDDDDRIRSLLSRYLREQGFVVATAKDGIEAQENIAAALFDALIVDVMMPRCNGLELAHYIRARDDTPILMLTALGETDDRIKGFESGVDDYLPKPFEPKELLLRLRALLRRRTMVNRTISNVTLGKWTFNPDVDVLTSGNGDEVKITAVEFKLLEALVRHAGKILSREELARLCGVEGNDRTVDVQITRLRKKIEEDSSFPKIIQTVRGQGYILKTAQGQES